MDNISQKPDFGLIGTKINPYALPCQQLPLQRHPFQCQRIFSWKICLKGLILITFKLLKSSYRLSNMKLHQYMTRPNSEYVALNVEYMCTLPWTFRFSSVSSFWTSTLVEGSGASIRWARLSVLSTSSLCCKLFQLFFWRGSI